MFLAARDDRTVRGGRAYSADVGPSAGQDLVKTLKGHRDAVRALSCFPRRLATSSNRSIGPFVFSGSDDTNVRVWNAATFECVHELKGHVDNVRVLTVDDRHLYSGSWDKTIRVWDLETFSCKHIINGHSEAVLALCVMGGHLVSGSYDTTVRIWGVQPETEFECVGVFGAHNDAVRVLTSAGRNATTVFSGSYDGSIGFGVYRSQIRATGHRVGRSHKVGFEMRLEELNKLRSSARRSPKRSVAVITLFQLLLIDSPQRVHVRVPTKRDE